jgi:hypothetical protein
VTRLVDAMEDGTLDEDEQGAESLVASSQAVVESAARVGSQLGSARAVARVKIHESSTSSRCGTENGVDGPLYIYSTYR